MGRAHKKTKVAFREVDHSRIEVGPLVEGRQDDGGGEGRRGLDTGESQLHLDFHHHALLNPGARRRVTYPCVPSQPHRGIDSASSAGESKGGRTVRSHSKETGCCRHGEARRSVGWRVEEAGDWHGKLMGLSSRKLRPASVNVRCRSCHVSMLEDSSPDSPSGDT